MGKETKSNIKSWLDTPGKFESLRECVLFLNFFLSDFSFCFFFTEFLFELVDFSFFFFFLECAISFIFRFIFELFFFFLFWFYLEFIEIFQSELFY
ncbi:hypothetical protein O3M35_007952 [Rhynocoris fuscipes]|uniref:Uncharacterized protein n=1 Tax=Rhynocoris fuscipes TaxID=488301 RepID=A0AAW1DCM3_9HEMI